MTREKISQSLVRAIKNDHKFAFNHNLWSYRAI